MEPCFVARLVTETMNPFWRADEPIRIRLKPTNLGTSIMRTTSSTEAVEAATPQNGDYVALVLRFAVVAVAFGGA